MSPTPDPRRLDQYRAKLAELEAIREMYRAHRDGYMVKVLNNRIRAQSKWIRKAQTAARRTSQ